MFPGFNSELRFFQIEDATQEYKEKFMLKGIDYTKKVLDAYNGWRGVLARILCDPELKGAEKALEKLTQE
ncbi:MAG: hypothetical protein KKF68_01535 [Nanoarchaeota archaeon]|nr:hypothetical protein [Nanoarchaeota archaeon]